MSRLLSQLEKAIVPGAQFTYTRYSDLRDFKVAERWDGVVVEVKDDYDTIVTQRLDNKRTVTFWNNSFICSHNFYEEIIINPNK